MAGPAPGVPFGPVTSNVATSVGNANVEVARTTCKAYGDVLAPLPMPSLPATYEFPVVVAPPLIVSPPACPPLPIVDEANAVKPFVNTGV